MTPAPIVVFVEVPFDWVAGILVPVAAVLVSAGIAIWLARREGLAAERDRAGAAATQVVRSLSEVAEAAAEYDAAAIEVAYRVAFRELNQFSVALETRDADVPKYVAAVLYEARTHSKRHPLHRRNGEEVSAQSAAAVLAADALRDTAVFLISCLEGWVRGQQPTESFARNMPTVADDVWVSGVDLGRWREQSTPATERSET